MPLSTATRLRYTRTGNHWAASVPGSPAEAYLAARGLAAAPSSLGIGYVTDDEAAWEPFWGMLAIPYQTATGVVTFKFRRLDDQPEAPKYLSMPGSKPRPYNTNDLHTGDVLAICEGELDAATLHLAGIPAVGLPSVSAWRPHWERLFRGHRRKVFWADRDDKGQGLEFAQKVCAEVDDCIVTGEAGHDVNSYAVAHGLDAVREKVSALWIEQRGEPDADDSTEEETAT